MTGVYVLTKVEESDYGVDYRFVIGVFSTREAADKVRLDLMSEPDRRPKHERWYQQKITFEIDCMMLDQVYPGGAYA